MMFTKFLTVLLLIELALDSISCQQCDVVLTSHADLKKEIRSELANALNDFMLHDNASSSIPQGCSTSGEMSTLREEIKQLREEMKLLLRPGHTSSHPADSCADILDYNNQSPSGYYWVQNSQGDSHRVYCDMTRTCGGVTGGWMKVAELDMTDNSNQCPTTLTQRTNSNKHTCVTNSNSAFCAPVIYSVDAIRYSKVCGKIKAYQFGSTDAFGNLNRPNSRSIDTNYLDGISLTYGSRPRKHIWTFAASLDEVGTYSHYNCPCTNINLASRASTPSAFVGNDYFCDTASQSRYRSGLFYSSDPLLVVGL